LAGWNGRKSVSSKQIQDILKGAIARLSEGDPAAALESLMPIYGTMERDPNFLRLFADAALRSNQREHAIAPLKQLVQIDIRDHAVHATLGDLLRQSKDFQGAMSHLAQSLKLQPKKPEYLFNLGICLMEVGELKRAEAAFRTALEYRSDYAKAAFGLARSLEVQNDLVGAEKYCFLCWLTGLRIPIFGFGLPKIGMSEDFAALPCRR